MAVIQRLGRVLLGACALSVLAAPAQPAETDPLWQNAVAIAAASEGWRPGRTVSRIEDLAKDGSVKSVDEVTFAYPPGTSEPQPQLVRFLHDGVDVTERERAKFAERQREEAERKRKGEKGDGKGGVTLGVGGTPFDPRHQTTVSFRRSAERTTVEGRRCQGFEYNRTDAAGSHFVGTALLDEETGAPLLVRERPDPLPRFADRVSVVLSFVYKGPGEWYPTRVDVEGSGGLLFIRKSIRTTIALLEFRREAASPAPR